MTSKTDKAIKPEVPTPPPATTEAMYFKMISIDLIDDPEQPMRTDMTPASVEDLVISIRQVGIIEPVVVKPTKGRFEIIAGHRRTYASRLAKVTEMPCYVRAANTEETEMLKIHENLYRSDVRPADEARHYDSLIKKHKMTPTQIANLISRSLSYVSDRLAILNYPDFLLDAMNNGEISFSVAREFAKFKDLPQMRSATFYAKRGGMTQEMARKWVQEHNRPKDDNLVQDPVMVPGQTQFEQMEHTSQCVYCREKVRLLEAAVVYMHFDCLQQANAQVIGDSPEASN